MIRNRPRLAAIALVPLTVLIAIAVAYAIGHATAGSRITTVRDSLPPVIWRSGIPVGVQNSQAGALAFADNYVITEDSSIEANPARFTRLIYTDAAPEFRSSAAATGRQLRQEHSGDMRTFASGGRGLTILAAHKLDLYMPGRAQVTVWVGGIAWGSAFNGARAWGWALETVRMRWANGQWWITEDRGQPAPATPTASWLNTTLEGFLTVGVQ